MTRRNVLQAMTLGLLANPALAQETQTKKDQTEKALTLQDALREAKVTDEVTLTIGPQWEKLPEGAIPPSKGVNPGRVSQAFGRSFRRFGTVAAIAPATMIILHTPSDNPNPFDGMPVEDLIPIFAESLNETQWAALSSESGLNLGTLSNTQKNIVKGIFPQGQLKVAPWYSVDHDEKQVKDLSGELLSSSLRVKQSVEVAMPSDTQDQKWLLGGSVGKLSPLGEGHYRLLPIIYGSSDTIYGEKVRSEVPNIPKRGQLNLRVAALQREISLKERENLKTVGDLMRRIAQVTQIEIYADRRWEGKTLMLLGTQNSAPAADLLQAMAFCLTGTFRNLGPAFVMTDDPVGLATRKNRWVEFEKLANALRAPFVEEARDKLHKRYSKQVFNSFGDPTALSPEQMTPKWQTPSLPTGELRVGRPLKDFTPMQQEMMRRATDQFDNGNGLKIKINRDNNYQLSPILEFQLLVPSLIQPLDINVEMRNDKIFQEASQPQDPSKLIEDMQKYLETEYVKDPKSFMANFQKYPDRWIDISQQYPEAIKKLITRHPELAILNTLIPKRPKITPTSLSKDFTHRGAWLRATNMPALAAEVEAAKKLQLTHLWFDVFTEGRAKPETIAFLDEALRLTKNTSLKIIPTISVFSWGKNMPKNLQDLNLLAENSVQAELRHQNFLSVKPKYDPDFDIEQTRDVAVNPLAPEVRSELSRVMQLLVAKPGVGGIALQDTVVPGYRLKPDFRTHSSFLLLGYQVEMRLAFLRAEHADPIDVYGMPDFPAKGNTDIPNFMYDFTTTVQVNDKWVAFRHKVCLEVLQKLHGIISSAKLPIFVVEKKDTSTLWEISKGNASLMPYTIWEDAKKALPEHISNGQETMTTTDNDSAKNPSHKKISVVPLETKLPLYDQLENAKNQKYAGFILETEGKSLVAWTKEIMP
jgi:hypothetical protein